MLGLLGFDPDEMQRRLGDGFYEQRLVREAVRARTGQRYLAGLDSDEAQFKYLMDNAIASKEALNLGVGVALSAEQVAALTHDIVWMEEREVQGQKVLVPVLYLAQAEGRLAPSGALIQGRDVTLISGGDLNNSGTLRATQNLSLTAQQNIANNGLMHAGERLSLLAGDSIRNTQGGILKGQDVSLVAVTGDVVNERTVSTHHSTTRHTDRQQSFVDSAARIEAGNDLLVSAGKDIRNIGGAISAGGDASLQAGNDLILGSAKAENRQNRWDRKGHSYQADITQYSSDVQVGGDLTAVAGRDLLVVGSTVKAGGDIGLGAGGDMTIASAANESSSDYYRKSGGKRVIAQEHHVKQVASVIEAGGNLDMRTDGNLVLVASQLKAGNEAYLYAGEQLALLAAQNSDYSLYDKEKKGGWGSKETQRDEITTVRNVGSSITTGGDLILVSEGDQLYQKARLESGNDLILDSGGSITFEAVKDLDQESHEKSSNSWAWTSAKGKGSTDETLYQSQLIAKGDLVIQAVDGLKIDVKEVNQQSVSQTIDAMVKADPELAWLKEMEQRGDVDWRQVKEIHDSFKYSHSGLGGPAMIIIAIIVTYLTAGAASGAIGSMAGAGAGSGSAMAAAGSSAMVSAGTAVGTASAGWANVALTAVATSAASNAAISTINNRGNLGAVVKDVTSSDNLKGYTTSALTAGITAGVLDSAFGVTGDNVNKVTKGFDLSKPSGLAKFGSYLGAQGAVQAVAQTAIQGGSLGGNLQTALTGQMQHLLQAGVFNAVGDFADGKWLKSVSWDDGSPEKIALHAVMGGLLSEATGGDFKTGALAAGANELLIERLSGALKGDKGLELMVSQLIGVATATATGGDPAKAAELAKNATAYNRQLHPDEIKFASDEERVKRYAEQAGISEDDARRELLRTAAAMVDKGWNDSLSELDGNTLQAASFLRAESSQSQSELFRVTLAEYNNERLGLKELFNNRDALGVFVKEVALVDPLAYKTDPRYFQEVLNAKGVGSQEGFGNAVEGVISSPSKAAVWLMGAANCPSCAMSDIQNAWDAVSSLPEELSYKAYLDNLYIMQGKGAGVVQQNAASSTQLGTEIGLAISPGLGGAGGTIDRATTVTKVAETAAEGGRLVYLSNSTAPGVRDRLLSVVSDMRADLPREGNVAFAEINVGALSSGTMVMKAYSQFDDRVGEFLPKPSGDLNSWVLKPQVSTSRYVGTPQGYLRDMDTEFKILETVAQRLGSNSQASGRINLISEKMVCPSCSDVVVQFRERYPNIQLNIFTVED